MVYFTGHRDSHRKELSPSSELVLAWRRTYYLQQVPPGGRTLEQFKMKAHKPILGYSKANPQHEENLAWAEPDKLSSKEHPWPILSLERNWISPLIDRLSIFLDPSYWVPVTLLRWPWQVFFATLAPSTGRISGCTGGWEDNLLLWLFRMYPGICGKLATFLCHPTGNRMKYCHFATAI